MSAVIEPYAATWHIRDGAFLIEATCDGDVIIHTKSGGVIAIGLDELADVEAALLNVRLWLERATKQHAELKAAEEVAQDEPQPLVCVRCEHPWHQGAFCDVRDCDDRPRCWQCEHLLASHGRFGCRCRGLNSLTICCCTVSNLTTEPRPASDRSWVSTERIREQP